MCHAQPMLVTQTTTAIAATAHLRYAKRATNRLGRAIFHAMVRFGPQLERRQMILFRAVDIGADLYAMAAACTRAQMLAQRGQPEAYELADVFCRGARERIARNMGALFGRNDLARYRLAQRVLQGSHAWLEAGIVSWNSGGDGASIHPVRPDANEDAGEAAAVSG